MEELFNDDVGDMTEETTDVERRAPACGVLSFHSGTEEAMFIYVQNHSKPYDVESILCAIDAYCYTRHWMMHIGNEKSVHLEDAVKSLTQGKPVVSTSEIYDGETCVEIGSYCGYSALRIVRLLSPNGKLYCIEREPSCVEWTRRLISYAGLEEKVVLLEGSVTPDILSKLSELLISNHQKLAIDLLFIDHDKSMYKCDLEIIISNGLLRSGSIVVADNVLSFNTPLTEYLNYVKDPNGLFSSSITYHSRIEYSASTKDDASATTAMHDKEPLDGSLLDAVEVSVYGKSE